MSLVHFQVTEANSRSQHDEEYIRYIREANAQSHELYIFDARKSARANVESYKAKGGGTENPVYYDNMRWVALVTYALWIHLITEKYIGYM